MIGIDLGVVHLVTTSNGEHLHPVEDTVEAYRDVAKQLASMGEDLAVEKLNKFLVGNLHFSYLQSNPNIFLGLLQEEMTLQGLNLIYVGAPYTSKRCSVCTNKVTERKFRLVYCKHCDTSLDRDINAARNILRLGKGLPLVSEAVKNLKAQRGVACNITNISLIITCKVKMKIKIEITKRKKQLYYDYIFIPPPPPPRWIKVTDLIIVD